MGKNEKIAKAVACAVIGAITIVAMILTQSPWWSLFSLIMLTLVD